MELSLEAPEECEVWAIQPLEYATRTLADNAVEHNDSDQPSVTLSVTEVDPETVRITVADNGPGIPSHEQDVLTRDEETDLEHGSGIGLWLARLVAEKSRGKLRFGDQSDGGRATMELSAGFVDGDELELVEAQLTPGSGAEKSDDDER